jgi:uncharacterized protein (DUF2141 family)
MKVLAIALIILVSFGIAFGEEAYTITGEVSFQYDGDIYICICTQDKWAEFLRPDHELSKSTCQIIKMNDKIQKAKIALFQLSNIPKGTYVIIAYQDVNGNGRTDHVAYWFDEPYGTYKETSPANRRDFGKNKFELDKDIRGIKIKI